MSFIAGAAGAAGAGSIGSSLGVMAAAGVAGAAAAATLAIGGTQVAENVTQPAATSANVSSNASQPNYAD